MVFVKNNELRVLAFFGFCSVLMVAFTFALSIEGMAVYDEFWVRFWVAITHSGSAMGITIVLLLSGVWMGLRCKSIKQGVVRGLVGFSILSLTVGGTALFNEYVIKERLKVFRPSILYLEKHASLNAAEYYAQEGKSNRRAYLINHLDLTDGESMYIDNRPLNKLVLKEWIRSAGYSFPSGHAVSAFLVVTLLGYFLLTRAKRMPDGQTGRKFWALGILYCWAVSVAYSRVLIGVHSPWDVTLGALWGSTIGFALIALGVFYFIKD